MCKMQCFSDFLINVVSFFVWILIFSMIYIFLYGTIHDFILDKTPKFFECKHKKIVVYVYPKGNFKHE